MDVFACNDEACNCTKRANLPVFANFLLSFFLLSEQAKSDSSIKHGLNIFDAILGRHTMANNSRHGFFDLGQERFYPLPLTNNRKCSSLPPNSLSPYDGILLR